MKRRNMFTNAIKEYAANTAFIYDENNNTQTISFMQVGKYAEHLGMWFQGKRIIMILAENVIETILGYIAAFSERVTVMMVRSNIDQDRLNALIRQFKPDLIWHNQNKSFVNAHYEEAGQWKSYQLERRTFHEKREIHRDLAVLLPTSGSLGNPKYVKLTYDNIENNTFDICKALDINADDRTITSLPMYYTYGLSIVQTHFIMGGSCVVTDKGYLERDFWEKFKSNTVTTFNGVPCMYENLHKMRISQWKLPSLKKLTQAGGKLMPELQKLYADYSKSIGAELYIMYGQTEATARMTVLPAAMAGVALGAVGKPIGNNRIEIIDREIVYYGNNIFAGYANSIGDLKLLEKRKLLHTGDEGYFDDEGYLHITGRKDEEIKLCGHRIDLHELENVIYKRLGLICHCIFWEGCIYLYVERDEMLIREWVSEYTGINKKFFRPVSEKLLKRNEYGKILLPRK